MDDSLIKAGKHPLALQLVTRLLIDRSLRGHFHVIWLHLDPAALALRRTPPARRAPVIFTSTHPSWWDGYLTWPVNKVLGNRDGYLMMDTLSLRHYRFFTWVGAFGIDRANPRAALESVEYSANLLKEAPNRAIWIFPQGTITPPDRRPLGLYPGVAHIARRLPVCEIVPVVWRLAYRYEQRAEIFIRVGAPLHLAETERRSTREITRWIDDALTAEDDRLADELTNGDISRPLPGYVPLMRGRASINRVWEQVQRAAIRLVGRDPGPPAP